MQEFYKGQKLYYKSKHGIQICEIIGWNHNSVYVKLMYGTVCRGPKWRVGFSMFNTAKDLVEAEKKHEQYVKEVEKTFKKVTKPKAVPKSNSSDRIIKRKQSEERYLDSREEYRSSSGYRRTSKGSWRRRDRDRRLQTYYKNTYK